MTGNLLVSKDAQNVVVQYDLFCGEKVKRCVVELQVSLDGGMTFQIIKDGLKGDVGELSMSGIKRIFIPLSKYPSVFSGKRMAFQINVHKIGVLLSADGYITFEASDKKDNAVIAAKDGVWQQAFGASYGDRELYDKF